MTTAERPPDPYELVEKRLPGAAVAVLTHTGPLPLDDLVWWLRWTDTFVPMEEDGAYGEHDERDLVEALVEHGVERLHRTADDLIAFVPALVDGIALSHVLIADQRRRSMIDLGVDLAVLAPCHPRFELTSGGQARVAYSYTTPALTASARALGLPGYDDADPNGSLAGPDGWLDAFAAGDLLSVHVHGRTLAFTRTHLRCLPRLARSPLVAALETAARQRIEWEHDGHVVLEGAPEDLVLDALAHDAALLRSPELPVATAFTHLGIEWDGDSLILRRHDAAAGTAS